MGLGSIRACHAADYYENAKETLYYLDGELAIGKFFGEGAESLGFSGPILKDQLANAFAGLSPDGTVSLVQKQHWQNRKRQPAWDVTLSVPKSVSVLWSVCSPLNRNRLEQIGMTAAERALSYADGAALLSRRGKKGATFEPAKGVYAICPHGTSRALDPQLHFHCLVMNLCRRSDGTTGAINSWDLYAHKMALGAVFRLQLAHLLQKELGLSISVDDWKIKVDGIPEKLCEEFSKRRKTIEAIAQKDGWTSPRALAEIALFSREGKTDVSIGQCFEQWQQTATKFGFTREIADQLFDRGRDKVRTADISSEQRKAEQLDRVIAKSVWSLSAYKSYFSERDLVRTAATEALPLGVSASELLKAVNESLGRFEYHLTKAESRYQHYTTRETVTDERELIDRASRRSFSERHLVPLDIVMRAATHVEEKLSKEHGLPILLTADQERALRYITVEPGAVKPLQGYAGTGKTQMLEAAHLAWREAGYNVLGATVTGRAAVQLQNTTQIPSVTLAVLLQKLNPTWKDYALQIAKTLRDAVRGAYFDSVMAGRWVRNPWKEAFLDITRGLGEIGRTVPQQLPNCRLSSNSILVLDEASMIPTKTFLAAVKACDKVGAKLVVVGDRLQLPPIEAGGPFWSLAKRLGYESLTTIVRQREAWMREATEYLINDEPLRALKLYAANDALHLEPTRQAAVEKLLADYGRVNSRQLPKTIALTATNEEARLVNHGLQRIRKASRQLGFFSLRLPSGERVHKHDRVLLTLNDYRIGVRNGFLGTVEAIHRTRGIMGPGSITVRLDDLKPRGWFHRKKQQSVTIDLKKYPHVQLGYAVTTHKIQSATFDRTFVLLPEAMLSKEMVFSQLTRAKLLTTLYGTHAQYGDSIELLAKQMTKETKKDLAHDHSLHQERGRNASF